ncbi:hypothetical protein KUG88_26895, partial [Rhodococcus rhodochrous]|nr:hypothetical protein [Rhodococcus rhodochrous]
LLSWMPENTQLTRARALFQSPTRQRRRSTPAPTKCEEPEWLEGRRYLGLDVLARCRLNTVTDTDSEMGADTMPALNA